MARTPGGIGVWNVESGRYRAEFVGCPSGVERFTVFSDEEQLFARCNGDAIGKWEAKNAINRIEELERSLAPNH